MDHATAKAVAHLIVHIFDLPFWLLVIRGAVWFRLFENWDLPTPTWSQTWGIVFFVFMLT